MFVSSVKIIHSLKRCHCAQKRETEPALLDVVYPLKSNRLQSDRCCSFVSLHISSELISKGAVSYTDINLLFAAVFYFYQVNTYRNIWR